jgi:hypothetical protein
VPFANAGAMDERRDEIFKLENAESWARLQGKWLEEGWKRDGG